MRDVCGKCTMALCVLLACSSAIPLLGQNSQRVLPPHAGGVEPLPVQPATPNIQSSEPQTTSGPYWTKLNNAPPVSVGAMLLLTDGRVLVHEEPNCSGTGCSRMHYTACYILTPDSTGSYINGTWTQAASLPPDYAPLYFGSAVLPDGKVLVEGGEYQCPAGQCAPSWTNLGALYDPAANTWSPVPPPSLPTPWANIGDAESVILPDGTYMQADCCGVALQNESAPLAAYFNEASLSWTELNQSSKFDEYDEEGWTLLPNGKVLTVDAYVACPSDQPACTAAGNSGSNSELWDPAPKPGAAPAAPSCNCGTPSAAPGEEATKSDPAFCARMEPFITPGAAIVSRATRQLTTLSLGYGRKVRTSQIRTRPMMPRLRSKPTAK